MGDILMSMGEGRYLFDRTSQPVLIVGRDGRPVADHGLFRDIPYLLSQPPGNQEFQTLINGPGLRPYIMAKSADRWTWRPYRPRPAEFVFSQEELEFAEPYRGRLMIEPTVKLCGHDNKAWPTGSWHKLINLLRAERIDLLQCLPQGKSNLVDCVAKTPTFRHAAAVLAVSAGFIGTEGGLMHAAAAVGTPTIILWSEFIAPEITGYNFHRNIRHAGESCGRRRNCPGCRASMEAITPGEVLTHVKQLLSGRVP